MQCRRPWFNSWVRKIHWRRDNLPTPVFLGFSYCSADKESACKAGDLGLIPELGRAPEEGKGYSLQYFGLENSMDCIVHGVVKNRTRLSDCHFHVSGVRAQQLACTEARLIGCSVCPCLVECEDRMAINTQNITLLKSLDWIFGSLTFSSQKQHWQTIKRAHGRQEKTISTKNWEITHSFPGRISLEVILSSPLTPGGLTLAPP